MRKTNADSRDPNGIARPGRVDLTTTLYGELRKLAAARMAREYGPQTLQATDLLHEAWLCLGRENQPQWEDRTHFYAAVADAMRHILVDRARRRQCIRYGGGLQLAHECKEGFLTTETVRSRRCTRIHFDHYHVIVAVGIHTELDCLGAQVLDKRR